PTTYLNNKGWKNLEDKFAAKTGKKLAKTQFKNKWDNMKQSYTWFMELKNAANGLGWIDATNIVDASKEWWDEHLRKCNNPEKGIKCNHVRFRKRGPSQLHDLDILFSNAHVTGVTAACPGDLSSDDSGDDYIMEVEKDDDIDSPKLPSVKKGKETKKRKIEQDKEEKSPFLRLYKTTCAQIGDASKKISDSVSSSSGPSSVNQIPTIAEVMKLVKECGVKEKTALMHTATFLIVKPEFRKIFTLLETKEGRLDLLERVHEK
ncbi:hypothetical protein BRADI_1g42753v3, partial [Brachypodium distachyon]